jgi:hypothetical protein
MGLIETVPYLSNTVTQNSAVSLKLKLIHFKNTSVQRKNGPLFVYYVCLGHHFYSDPQSVTRHY